MKTRLLILSIAFIIPIGIKLKAQPTYCTSNLHGASSCGTPAGYIDSVEIAGTTLQNYSTTCGTNAYTAYSASGSTTATLGISNTYTLKVYLASVYMTQNDISAWIDFNQNGTFDNSEWIDLGRNVDSAGIATFTVPANAVPGLTGMRIRNRYSGSGNDSISACSNFSSGETEDYILTIAGTTGIDEAVSQNEVRVYPNPSSDILNVGLMVEGRQPVALKLASVNGANVFSYYLADFEGEFKNAIDVSAYSKGVYTLHIQTGSSVVVRKVILK
jgi:hypothetical protein